MSIQYTGIEEAVEIAGSLGISDFKTAFLFIKRTTGQVFTQLFCDETKEPIPYRDKNMLYCGKLSPEDTYEEIVKMVRISEEQAVNDKKYAAWLEEHGI